MSLYLKYRPSTLKEVIGNEDVVAYLETVLDKETPPHVFLLHGPTGCGKTTLARIVARELGADDLDIKEIDTADFNGIDSVREIIRNSKYKAMGGSIRVWIIDEVHRMTSNAQDAFLKLLEDTPSHVYFILATTDPNKLLKTVRGRCIELQVNTLSETDLYKLLKRVVKKEGETLDKDMYELIGELSGGHPRNALQLLEKALDVPEAQRAKIVQQASVEIHESIELCRALMQNASWKKVSGILNGLKDQDPESIRRHVLGYCQSVLLGSPNDQAARIMEEFLQPVYDSGFPGIVYYCYCVTNG